MVHFLLLWIIAGLSLLGLGQRQQQSLALVAGRILDPISMRPVAGAEAGWKSQTARSDETGHYEISIPVGIRDLLFSAAGRSPVHKLIIGRTSAAVVLDVLLPADSQLSKTVLALDRGSLTSDGKDLESDVRSDSTISLADEYGNQDHLLLLRGNKLRVHAPLWLDARNILFGKEGTLHLAEDYKYLGIFQYLIDGSSVRQLAAEVPVQFLGKSPRANALVLADQKNLFVMNSLSDSVPRRIFSLPPNEGFLLSVAWGPDDRIYFTVDDSIKVDDRHALTKSRIASIRPDGTGLNPAWAGDTQYSYRYPVRGQGQQMLLSRFSLDGKQQTLWTRDLNNGTTRLLLQNSLRAVCWDSNADRLYYIYQQQLHLRKMRTGDDVVIVNSVREADCLQ